MGEQPEERASEVTSLAKDRMMPRAPAYGALPTARMRSARRAREGYEMSVRLEVVTPILGGSTQTRAVDEVDVIRAATVRGHLRFWWRALYAARYSSAQELYERESQVWGRAATDGGGRSAVEIRIDVERHGAKDESDIDLQRTPGAYGLWPARAERRQGQVTKPPAPRRMPGTEFRLTLIAAASCEPEVRNALRAWILFGGYGSRTRRGLGSLTVVEDRASWLPSEATRAALKDLFGFDVLVSPANAPGDTPWLAGASLRVGKAERDAIQAWTTALDWLKEFRQGTSGGRGDRARERGAGKPQPQRPSISNWPEADKVRRLSSPKNGLKWAHNPRHNGTPAWPRAGFGLPIIGQFQQQSREARPDRKKDEPKYLYWHELPDDDPNYGTEPAGFELRWRAGGTEHDRLASPLIVKALPLANGTFAPCALWLNRVYPRDGEVGLARPKHGGRPEEKEVDPATVAPFDRLVAPRDTPQFSALAGKHSLRQAFLDWLQARYRMTVVAP